MSDLFMLLYIIYCLFIGTVVTIFIVAAISLNIANHFYNKHRRDYD